METACIKFCMLVQTPVRWFLNCLKEETEAWGVKPYDIKDADTNCKALVRKGVVRVADIKFPLPYRPKSFSLVIVSDALDYLSPRYLNETLPDLARVLADGFAIFTECQVHRPLTTLIPPISHFCSLSHSPLNHTYCLCSPWVALPLSQIFSPSSLTNLLRSPKIQSPLINEISALFLPLNQTMDRKNLPFRELSYFLGACWQAWKMCT
ncbi:uncharacterized protein LOC108982094 [Juglans regia]|uniref:Uncharacterized protein LOC108982094 n=1 Tax=Juglans regia TaxID=51240 RepID=A0A6P9EDU2_JUGRE|nr:uncharacterized protein LOC108982094 [Juglans regia]